MIPTFLRILRLKTAVFDQHNFIKTAVFKKHGFRKDRGFYQTKDTCLER